MIVRTAKEVSILSSVSEQEPEVFDGRAYARSDEDVLCLDVLDRVKVPIQKRRHSSAEPRATMEAFAISKVMFFQFEL